MTALAVDGWSGAEPSSVQEVVDRLAAETGVPVTLEDADLRLLVHSAHGAVVDGPRRATIMSRQSPAWVRGWMGRQGLWEARGPVRLAADPTAGLLGRVVVPVRRQGRLVGWLWLLDAEGCVDGEAVAVAQRAGVVAGRLLARGRGRGPAGRQARDALVGRLLTADPAGCGRAAAEAMAGGLPVGPVRVVVAEAGVAGSAGSAGVWRRGVEGPPAVWGHGLVHEGRLVGLVGVAESVEGPHDLGGRLRRALLAAGVEVAVGVGAVQEGLVEVAAGYRQAVAAAVVAGRVAEVAGVGCWEALGAYRALLSLPQPIDVALLDPRVSAVGVDGVVRATVEVYLDEGASPGRTARRLGVHRGTVYYRVQRFAELTGCDLENGADRLAVHLTLKALRLTTPA